MHKSQMFVYIMYSLHEDWRVLKVDKKRRQKKRRYLAGAVTLLWICIWGSELVLPAGPLLLPTGIPAGGQRALPFLLLLLLCSSLGWWSSLILRYCHYTFTLSFYNHFHSCCWSSSIIIDQARMIIQSNSKSNFYQTVVYLGSDLWVLISLVQKVLQT